MDCRPQTKDTMTHCREWDHSSAHFGGVRLMGRETIEVCWTMVWEVINLNHNRESWPDEPVVMETGRHRLVLEPVGISTYMQVRVLPTMVPYWSTLKNYVRNIECPQVSTWVALAVKSVCFNMVYKEHGLTQGSRCWEEREYITVCKRSCTLRGAWNSPTILKHIALPKG